MIKYDEQSKAPHLGGIAGRLIADEAANLSNTELARVLGPCVGAIKLIPLAQKYRDEGLLWLEPGPRTGIIKVCIRPTCDEVAHNCPKSETHCRNCGMGLVKINQKTYMKKFINYPHQIDYSTNERVTPQQMGINVQKTIFDE